MLGTKYARDVFLRILEQVRRKHKFEVAGYVAMPEHLHALIGEPEKGNPSTVLQVLKQEVAKRLLKPGRKRRKNQAMLWQENELPERRERHFWQPRFHDFNVYSNEKRLEKLRYMHANPVKRGLVSAPELWAWSSCRAYMYGASSVVRIDELETIRQKKEQPQK